MADRPIPPGGSSADGKPLKGTLHADEIVIRASYLRGTEKARALLRRLNEKARDD